MGLFDNLFGKKTNGSKNINYQGKDPEHAVIVRFNYGMESLDDLHELEERLRSKIEGKKIGEYDGHEISIDGSDGILYMYGPNAEVLFKTVKPILEETEFMSGAKATLRFGPPEDGAREIEVEI
ncbi:MAG TPA: hypothetical protein VJ765_16790 [Chitinophagaceae bacterium]|nr:hypothetical protein [Chitinophagaceae bacterium]